MSETKLTLDKLARLVTMTAVPPGPMDRAIALAIARACFEDAARISEGHQCSTSCRDHGEGTSCEWDIAEDFRSTLARLEAEAKEGR